MTQANVPILNCSDPELTSAPGHEGTGNYRLGYFFFLLVNATIFIRPGEIFPETEGWPIYNVLILISLAACLPAVLKQLEWKSLVQNPGALCILGLMPAIMLSHLSHGRTIEARRDSIDYSKILVYFFLLVGLIDSLSRLRHFLGVTTLFILAIAIIALLKYHGIISIDAISVLNRGDGVNQDTGAAIIVQQLQASGIFSDPNDFSLILAVAVILAMYFATQAQASTVRYAWIATLPILMYAFALTKSRGGFLALLAGLAVFILCRWGRRRGMIIGICALPLILLVFAGRQTNIDITNKADTAQGRILLWREGMALFKEAPVFGSGYNTYAERATQVAHNTYVNTYAELGFFGGTLFLSAVLIPIFAARKFATLNGGVHEAEYALNACVVAILVSYAVGMFSLSRIGSNATFLVLGVGCASALLMARLTDQEILPPLNWQLIQRLILCSIGMVCVLYCFTRFLVF